VLIDVQVSGDDGDRLARALSGFFTRQGFRAGPGGEYTLDGAYTLEPVDVKNDRGYVYFRYVFQAVIQDGAGKEVLAFAANGREGHLSEAEARQRALRAVESGITSGDFARRFDEHLTSLL
jgi:hypothetical protein